MQWNDIYIIYNAKKKKMKLNNDSNEKKMNAASRSIEYGRLNQFWLSR